MPRALIINPNTSKVMTADIAATAAKVFGPDWQWDVVEAPGGPESLESSFDYALAACATLALTADRTDYDGAVLACFGDPGLFSLKEVVAGPVVGIAEASFATALLVGYKFGVLMGLPKAIPLTEPLIAAYGLEKRCAGLMAMEMPVLEFERQRERTRRKLLEVGKALADRGAESLILGCAGLTGLAQDVSASLGMPIIDPVEAGCRQLRLLVEMGLHTSRVGLYAPPPPKAMHRLENVFAPKFAQWLRRREADVVHHRRDDRHE